MRRATFTATNVVRAAVLGLVFVFGALPASAAMISGDLTFSGDWTEMGGGVATATGLSFPGSDFDVDGSTGDFSSIVQGDIGTIADFDFSLSGGAVSLLSIAGFDFSLDTLSVVFQNSSVILLEGSGIVGGNGFDDTAATFSLSANVAGPLKVMSGGISAQPIPVPGALLLFGSALAALGWRRR